MLACLVVLCIVTGTTLAQTPPLADRVHHPNGGRQGMVVAEDRLAAQVGAEILAQGGNAVDAAVATSFALAVTYPRAGNIGGGGFMLVYLRESGRTVAIDYREMAPAAAGRDMYLDGQGRVDEQAILYSHRSSGVPGTVAGLLHALEKYGKLTRREVMAPAIRLADEGFTLSFFAASVLAGGREALSANPAALAEFFKPDGSSYLPGEKMRRPDLARTLGDISRDGRDGFYKGRVAQLIAADMAANQGLITLDDLAGYEVKERLPVTGTYRGYEIQSMPPPSSGGIHLIQMLNMLETRPPHAGDGDSAAQLHFLAEVMRRAYADRSEHLGDPDFAQVPQQGLVSKDYARALAAGIDSERATPSADIGPGKPEPFHESPDTTQVSVIDAEGNMVASTYTLNLSYGSGIVVPGTGILLNNEMDDFSAAPGVPNAYGLVGGDKNAIAPRKRPLSSMTPTLVFRDGEPFMATGAPGGARIITAVLNVIVNVVDRGMNIADATDHPRIHHQWLPDEILYEPGLSLDTMKLLEAMGHTLTPFDWYARPQTAVRRDGWIYGYTDTRVPGGGACSPDGGC
jgi:gamma-glutamyltranspeptidase/glutathione hydrolase